MEDTTGNQQVDAVLLAMGQLLTALSLCKPNDRSGLDRVFAIALTDAEKLYAYFHMFATRELNTAEHYGPQE